MYQTEQEFVAEFVGVERKILVSASTHDICILFYEASHAPSVLSILVYQIRSQITSLHADGENHCLHHFYILKDVTFLLVPRSLCHSCSIGRWHF